MSKVIDTMAQQHLDELDNKFKKNIDVVADEQLNQKVSVKENGRRVLLDNSQAYGSGEKDRFDFGNTKGWIEVPIGMIPSKGMFYPEDAKIFIKSAEVGEIKHWSTLDPNSFLDVDSKMNYVLERCLNFVNDKSKVTYSWKDILEIDRLYLIFRVSELTFPGETNKLKMTFTCTSACKAPRGEQGQYKKKDTISSRSLYLFELDDYLHSLYSPDSRCFVKHLKEGGELKFYIPSTGVASSVKNLIVELRESGEVLDPFIIKILPYIIKDYKTLNADLLKKLAVDIIGWNKNKILFINGVVEKIESSVHLEARHTCTKCNAVLEVPLFFRGEPKIKDLFTISDGLDDLV